MSLPDPSPRSDSEITESRVVLISLEITLVEITFSLDSNIMFLKTRQAMMFINAILGTVNNVRRTGGSDWKYRKVTVMRLKVTVDLAIEKGFS